MMTYAGFMLEIPEQLMYTVLHVNAIITSSIKIVHTTKDLSYGIGCRLTLEIVIL